MKDHFKEIREDVMDEQNAIEESIERMLKLRSDFDPKKEDYSIEPAMGVYLMNFYNGIENIIKRISKAYYLTIPKGESWHKELLQLSINPPDKKIPLFTKEIVANLHSYLSFRHRFTSGYGFQLKGEKMIDLIDNIKPLWEEIKNTLSRFWARIEKK
jgi:hypothetical protein